MTGLNEAFVIDTPTRDGWSHAIRKSGGSAETVPARRERQALAGGEPEGLFLINTPKGKVDIEDYPGDPRLAAPFKPRLRKRATKQEWWELQQAQLSVSAEVPVAKDCLRPFCANSHFCTRAKQLFFQRQDLLYS